MAQEPGIRNTSIVFVEFKMGPCFVVASLSKRKDTNVITIDRSSGSLQYSGVSDFDNFASESDALECILDASRGAAKNIVYGKAILGYAVFGNLALLLLATKIRASIITLPTGDCVYTVEESRWMRISLTSLQILTKEEERNITDLVDIAIDGFFYFCETRDITRPFPSSVSVLNPDIEFVWNAWLSAPFTNLRLPRICVVLLQGAAECRKFTDSKGRLAAIAHIARRSRFHPGTRYLARGLNAAYSTGNEVECEQLVWWCGITSGRVLKYSTYVWRQGTVPIWWKAEIKSAKIEADINVSAANPYKGAAHYYRRLVVRYGHTSEASLRNSFIPIVCVNLLRGVVDKPEWQLCWHFQQSIDAINTAKEIPEAKLSLLNFDWHTNIRVSGDTETVTKLWRLLKHPASEIGIQVGEILAVNSQQNMNVDSIPNNDVRDERIQIISWQNGVFRFNCADSVDRTNCATFFAAIQVLGEQCRRLDIALETCENAEHRESWGLYDLSFEEFRIVTISHPISLLADLFIYAGNVHAVLYTGSKAMHSQVIECLGKDAGAHKKSSAAQNMAIILQRKYANIMLDAVRQRQIENFLGLRKGQYFPSIFETHSHNSTYINSEL